MGETFPDDDELGAPEQRYRDEDDDIPPPATTAQSTKKVKMIENEEDFFDVSESEENISHVEVRPDEGTKAWRD